MLTIRQAPHTVLLIEENGVGCVDLERNILARRLQTVEIVRFRITVSPSFACAYCSECVIKIFHL